MEDKTKKPTEKIINVHPSNAKAVKEFFDKKVEPSTESVLSAEQYVRRNYPLSQTFSKLGAINIAESFANLCVQHEREFIKESIMIELSESLNDSHIYECEYQKLRKNILRIFNHGK